MFYWLLIIIFILALYLGFYYLGKIACKKIDFLKKNINKNVIIILSIILIPLGMAADKEVLAYGIGFALSPLLGTLVAHLIAIKLFAKKAKKGKKQSFFNNDFYYGFFGILAVSYFSLLFPVN